MALVQCPECRKEISNTADRCPHCGFNIQLEIKKQKEIDIQQDMYKAILDSVELPQPPQFSFTGLAIDIGVFVLSAIALLYMIIILIQSDGRLDWGNSIMALSIIAILTTAIIPIAMYHTYKTQQNEYALAIQNPDEFKKRIADKKMKAVSPASNENNEYTFHYLVAFFIPIVGFVLGAILLGKDDEEMRSKGKNCIWLGIASVVGAVIVYNMV